MYYVSMFWPFFDPRTHFISSKILDLALGKILRVRGISLALEQRDKFFYKIANIAKPKLLLLDLTFIHFLVVGA